MRHHKLVTVGLLIFACVLFGCQTKGKTRQSFDPVEQLKARANEYWDYKVKNKFEKAFAYEDPDTIKGINLTDYIRSIGGGVRWLGAEVDHVKIDGDTARVLIKMRYVWTFTQNVPEEGMVSKFPDRWKLKNGTWYHVFRMHPGLKSKTVNDK